MVTKPEMEILLRQVDPVPDNLSDDVSAALLTSIVERRDEMTRTDLPNPVQHSSPEPPRPRRYAWAFGGALAMMLTTIGIVIVFIAGSGDEAAGPTTVPPIETPIGGTWTRAVIEPTFQTSALRATSLGLIAVGDGIWIAEDGANWRQAFAGPFEPFAGTTTTPAPPLTVPPPAPQVHSVVDAVVEFDSTIYAFGSVYRNENSDQSASQVVVWSSGDGITWDENVVEEGGPGLRVATAIASEDMIAAYEHGGSRIMYSPDGAGWTILDPAESGLGGVGITDVTLFDGQFIAVGEEHLFGDVNQNSVRAIYRSSDGLHFEKAPESEFGENSYPYALTGRDGVLFAAGQEFVPELGDAAAAVWHSRDGIDWQQMILPESTRPGWSSAGTPIAADNGLIVTVSRLFYDDTSELSVFVTQDGMEVEQIPASASMLENATEEVTGTFFKGRLILLARGPCSPECDPARPLIQLTWTP